MDFMEAISDLCKTIESMVRLVGIENTKSPLRINARQCEVLAKKASGVVHVLEELQNGFHRQEDGVKPTLGWTPGALELHRVLKDAEILIRDCCCCDGLWLEAAIKRGNLKETFGKLLYDMEWHTSVLCSALVTKRDRRDVLDRSACGGKLGITEDFMLSSAVKQDRQSLRELIRGSHECSEETCKPDDKQSCLAMKFLEKLDAEEEDLDRSALLSKSQSPLFLWVPSKDLIKGQVIGHGSFGVVQEATWLGQKFAVKTLAGGAALRKLFRQEIAAMAGLDHPHIVRIVSCSEDNRNLSIVMELMYKSLSHVLEDYKSNTHAPGATTPFPIIQSVDLMLQIAEGVRYLHSQGLAHRDLKSLNILLQFADPQAIEASFGFVPFTDSTLSPFIAKIADFGLTKMKHASTSNHTLNVGTRPWMAPELFKLADSELPEPSPRFRPMKMDAYSFGMVCYEILSGETPFADINPPIIPVRKFQELVKGGKRPKLPKDIPTTLAELIQRCWDGDSRRRPDFPTICTELRYIKGLLLLGNSLALERTTIGNVPVFDLQAAEIKQVQGPWGGNGGGHFFDGVVTSIKQMKLKYDSNPSPCIWYMEMTYDVNGTSFTIGHGDVNHRSSTASIQIDEPSEYITQIEGWTGIARVGSNRVSGLTSLTIRTNEKTYGPFGGESETKFTSDNGKVIGFYGRCGMVIDQIGCFVAPAEG